MSYETHLTEREAFDRRERIATAALQGLLGTSSLASASTYAAAAVKAADALIAELDKQP